MIKFDMFDTDSGFSMARPADHVSLKINGIVASLLSFQQIAPSRQNYQNTTGFRAIYFKEPSWMNPASEGGFGVVQGQQFTWEITVTDSAGNTSTQTTTLTIAP